MKRYFQKASLTSFPPQSLTWSRFSTYKVQRVCFAYIYNIFMCRYLKFWSIETIVKLKIQNCSTSSNEVHSWSIKDYEIAELFFRTGGVKSHLRCDRHVFRYLQPFCVTKSETCQMHLLQLLRKLTYCRDRSSSRYPCYSSRKPPGEGAMLSYNTICWTQSSKWNCFGIGISWRKVRWYTFQLWRPHYHVLRDEILTDIETISFPSQTFPTETETNYDDSDTNSFSRQNFFCFSQDYCQTDFWKDIFFSQIGKVFRLICHTLQLGRLLLIHY